MTFAPWPSETHSTRIVDPVPRFIRETLEEAGIDGVRVGIAFPQFPDVYVITRSVRFGPTGLLDVPAALDRSEYDALSSDTLVMVIRERWRDELQKLYDWLGDEDML